MNLDFDQALNLVVDLVKAESKFNLEADVILIPPALYVRHIAEYLKQARSKFKVGVQDVSANANGAYTGELSATMSKVAGADFTLIGHSERRIYQNESSDLLNQKIRRAIEAGLQVIFCCGEQLGDRKNKKHFEVVKQQLESSLLNFSAIDWKSISIAYEPVWAIGTGEHASPEQAQEMHEFIRSWIKTMLGSDIAAQTQILYGGSMKPDNAEALLKQADVDGGLVGGASLELEAFVSIINAAS